MYIILAVILVLIAIQLLLLYKVLVKIVIPKFCQSPLGAKYKAMLSDAIRQLWRDIGDDIIDHLHTILEADGDEPFEPYLDSPLRTCPSTEYLLSEPKEEIQPTTDINNNALGRVNLRGTVRGRGRARRGHNMLDIPAPPYERPPNPAVLLPRI